ncbi:hypothetical protein [Streptomyces malaysiensis]|uniref:Cytochrome c oxidase cbb3-type subunit I n=1 Tax=Streptomyces malaysiensis TaxID=92644 RepID=A0A7X5X7K9_STRMQ|nr:hypothetical protein [Streptomyces malaysiensis]NIY68088.1 cytochrome c oxidase cbb3-type subunit I [Streptomyces malaysiensis]
MSLLYVYIVEVFSATTGETIGFYPITASGMDAVAVLAGELCVAFNHGREVGGTDWRQIAEHPYQPGATDTAPSRPGAES